MNGGEFLQPECMYPTMARCFPIWYFLVSFSVYQCVFPLPILFRVLLYLSPCCLSIRFFVKFSLLPYFTPELFSFSVHPVVGMCSCHLLQLVGRIFFRCFGMFCFVCIALSFVDSFLIFLLSPVLSDLFPQIVLIFFLVLLFSFCPMFQRFSFVLTFLSVFKVFISAFPVEFPIQILIFCSCSLKEPRFSHKLILLLYLLVLFTC